MKSILILGAGVMQVPAIRIARAKGWRVIVADGNPEALAAGMGDRFEHVDLKDRDRLLEIARVHARTGLDGVFTAGTDFSTSVAWVAEHLGLPGISYQTALRATDKFLMREAFLRAGVPSPFFVSWTGAGDPLTQLPSDLRFPLVIKPVDNMGARGVRRVDNTSEVRAACDSAMRLSRSSRVIIEEYMKGPELSLDAVVYRGEVTVCGIADRHIFFPPHFVEMGHTIPTALDGPTVREIEAVFVAGIHALGIDNGAAKGDIKLTASGPMVGEIAARLSGGYMSGWTFPLSSGVEVTEAAMNVAVGLPPGDLSPTRHRTTAERALISIPGVVGRLEGVEEARQLPGIAEIFLRTGPGETVKFPTNNVEKCGNVIAVADTREKSVAAAQRALSMMRIRLRPLTEITTRYLATDSVNEAFPEISERLRAAITRMPSFIGDPSRAEPGSSVPILDLPGADEPGIADWYGMSFAEAARQACTAADGVIVPSALEAPFALGSIFWRAILRAGGQAGVYVLDSMREARRSGRTRELLG